MISKFSISYTIFPEHNKRIENHHTDDPVAAETFIMQLLLTGARIQEIRHDGVPLEPHQSDRMIKIAAERIASRLIRASLDMDYVEVRHRFGFAC